MKDNMPAQSESSVASEWWRWPLVPIAAFVGGALGSFLFGLIQWLGMKVQGGFTEDGWMYRYILPVITSAAFGWFYAWISCAVAPRGKVITGTVMITILFLVGATSVTIAWLAPQYQIGDAMQITIGSIASFVAAVFVLVQVHADERSNQSEFSR